MKTRRDFRLCLMFALAAAISLSIAAGCPPAEVGAEETAEEVDDSAQTTTDTGTSDGNGSANEDDQEVDGSKDGTNPDNVDTGDLTETETETEGDNGSEQKVPEEIGPTCMVTADAFAMMLPATYEVGFLAQVGPNDGDVAAIAIGTAFAIDRRLLATNGHVAQAFIDTGKEIPMLYAFALRHGSDEVMELTRAITHPDWDKLQSGIYSPDIALFTTKEELPVVLELATPQEVVDLAAGDELALTGYPGDVDQQRVPIIPGVTVPQATALSGTLTALRSFFVDVEVTPSNTDVVQHQLPTSGGTSGSPLVRCGKVIGVNNSGTVDIIVTVDEEGNLVPDRTTAAANNFGIHVRHLEDLVSQFRDNAIQGVKLPPEYDPTPIPPDPPTPAQTRDAAEPNDDFNVATVVQIGNRYQPLSIYPATDTDVFALTLANPTPFYVETAGATGGDTVMGVYTLDNNGNPTEVGSNDDKVPGEDLFSRVDFAASMPANTYYIVVISFNQATEIHDYSLIVAN